MRLIRCFTKPRKTHIDFRDTQLVDLMLACANTSICSLQYSVYSRTYKLLFFFCHSIWTCRCRHSKMHSIFAKHIIYIYKETRDTEKKTIHQIMSIIYISNRNGWTTMCNICIYMIIYMIYAMYIKQRHAHTHTHQTTVQIRKKENNHQ